MAGISLVLAMLLGQAAARDPAELVRQLGSTRFAEREAAMAALDELGPAALPALRVAAASKDPELRRRVAVIAARIDWREPDRAWPIRLDVWDRPLDAIVETFGFPSPSRLAWHPDTPDSVRLRHVTIREPGMLPFWTAIDRLCRAGGLRYIPGSPGGPGDGRPPQFRLFLAPGPWDGPRADSGPLRLEIVRIEHSRSINLVPNRPNQWLGRGSLEAFGARHEVFWIEMRVLAEPRMLIDQVGSGRIAEMVDDRGRSLLPGPAPFPVNYNLRYRDGTASSPYFLNLKYPEQAGPVIKRLRLTIPVGVEALEPDRLEIPLGDAVGKTIRHGTTSIEVLAIGPDSQGHQVVKLKLSSTAMVPERLDIGPDGKPAPVAGRPAEPEVTPNIFQVLDQHGRQFPWHAGTIQVQGSEVTAELMMWPSGGIPIPVPAGHGIVPVEDRATAVPAVLYHTELAHTVIMATFEFHDVPLP